MHARARAHTHTHTCTHTQHARTHPPTHPSTNASARSTHSAAMCTHAIVQRRQQYTHAEALSLDRARRARAEAGAVGKTSMTYCPLIPVVLTSNVPPASIELPHAKTLPSLASCAAAPDVDDTAMGKPICADTCTHQPHAAHACSLHPRDCRRASSHHHVAVSQGGVALDVGCVAHARDRTKYRQHRRHRLCSRAPRHRDGRRSCRQPLTALVFFTGGAVASNSSCTIPDVTVQRRIHSLA